MDWEEISIKISIQPVCAPYQTHKTPMSPVPPATGSRPTLSNFSSIFVPASSPKIFLSRFCTAFILPFFS